MKESLHIQNVAVLEIKEIVSAIDDLARTNLQASEEVTISTKSLVDKAKRINTEIEQFESDTSLQA